MIFPCSSRIRGSTPSNMPTCVISSRPWTRAATASWKCRPELARRSHYFHSSWHTSSTTQNTGSSSIAPEPCQRLKRHWPSCGSSLSFDQRSLGILRSSEVLGSPVARISASILQSRERRAAPLSMRGAEVLLRASSRRKRTRARMWMCASIMTT